MLNVYDDNIDRPLGHFDFGGGGGARPLFTSNHFGAEPGIIGVRMLALVGAFGSGGGGVVERR